MNVKIISDSTCDLSSELVSRYDIEIVPLSVILGDFTGRDGIEVTPAKIYQHVAECKELPKTSAVNTEEYVRVFRSWREKGYSIVHYCISSEFSSCYQNACAAAQEMDEVYVVDSRNLSSGQGLLVLKGAEMARAWRFRQGNLRGMHPTDQQGGGQLHSGSAGLYAQGRPLQRHYHDGGQRAASETLH